MLLVLLFLSLTVDIIINKYSIVPNIQTSFEQDINPIRQHRWDELNLVLKNNKKAKVMDGELTSSNYSSITWKEVGPILTPELRNTHKKLLIFQMVWKQLSYLI